MIIKELFNAFDQKISKTAIVYRDTEYVIQGKFCVIAPIGSNKFDMWICNAPNISKGLDQRTVRNIAANLFKGLSGSEFTELTGEAHGVVVGTELILQNLKLLGIRKKRELSSENLEKLKIQFGEARRVA